MLSQLSSHDNELTWLHAYIMTTLLSQLFSSHDNDQTWLHAYIITTMLSQLLSSHDNTFYMVTILHHNNHAQTVVIIAWERFKNSYTLTS